MPHLTLLTTFLAGLSTCLATTPSTKKHPNIIFILTDDQDYELDSLSYMPRLQKYLISQGTLYPNHYCTVSICCPSRVNIWTGLSAHNTNVTDLHPPYGGYPKFVKEGFNDNWLPVWLQKLGYATYYVGKLMNAHNVRNFREPEVKGWDGSEFLLDPFTYEYYDAKMTRNGEEPVSYKGLYSVDVVAEKAYGFLDEATSGKGKGKPFFLGVAPIAPHSNMRVREPVQVDMPMYAERHGNMFKDYKIPRTKNFNPETPSGTGWVRELERLNATAVEYLDEFVRARLRSLQAVDEMVEELITRLEKKGILDETYIFYSSDNGYHVGQHRLPPGKECAFEEDIHVPLIVRGPGIPKGHVADVVSSHTDLAPTFLKLAGSERLDLDGRPIPLKEDELEKPNSGEHVNVEFWGIAIPEGRYGKIGNYSSGRDTPGDGVGARNNTYKALRVVGEKAKYSFLYVVRCTGEREFYDMTRDPYQMQNLLTKDGAHLAETFTLAGRSFKHVLSRVDALLMVTKSCKAESCRSPWRELHPRGNVGSILDALHTDFDAFYEEQPRISFSSCQLGYIRDEEGPQDVNVWDEDADTLFQGGEQQQQPLRLPGHWSWWT